MASLLKQIKLVFDGVLKAKFAQRSYFHIGHFEQQALTLQALYDSETSHSLNILIQKQWDKKIDSLLDVYKDFAAPVFRIQIGWKGHQ
jgi:hypothetical protein